MTTQKQSMPSFATILSVLSIVLYCAGFLRVELELNDQNKRINVLENVVDHKPPPRNEPTPFKITNNAAELQSYKRRREKRQDNLNATDAKLSVDTLLKINQLISDMKPHLCQSKNVTCLPGPPGPTGPPGLRGEKGSRGKRGQKGRIGKRGDQGILGSPGKSGKQGIMGPVGPQGETGLKGQKGDIGPAGMPGTKGEPGESISAPTVVVSPARLTVNESASASFQCSVIGNPKPAVMWSKLNSSSDVSQSVVSGLTLRLQNVKGSDSGVYQCLASNVLGKTQNVARLVVNVHPFVSIHSGPLHAIEGSNVTLPTCHVTGHPKPVVTWSKSFGQLPQGRVQKNNSVIKLLDVRKVDSDNYFCTATNLLGSTVKKTLFVVVSLPRFTAKPPVKLAARTGDIMRVNCSASGDPQPVISWKKQGAHLPVGRSQVINGALVIRDIKKEDAGIYICVATSAGVFDIETVTSVAVYHKDCSDLLKSGQTQNGVYSVNPDGRGYFNVHCDMRTDGGGWTVFQRRQDGSVDFYRGWNDYKSGFGQLAGEFWLGNDKIHRLTAARPSSLRVELEDWNGVRVYAKYGRFNIGDEQAQYRLAVSLNSGTAGDSLIAGHNNMAFSTKDRDNDRGSRNCAVSYTGAWWYNNCHYSNVNGKYVGEKHDYRGAVWQAFRGSLSLKFTEMKLRPSS